MILGDSLLGTIESTGGGTAGRWWCSEAAPQPRVELKEVACQEEEKEGVTKGGGLLDVRRKEAEG
jgi:hypothetical protein